MKRVIEPRIQPDSASAGRAGSPAGGRLARERQTVAAMIRLYCRAQHRPATALCAECQQLQDYADTRLARCRFGIEKPTCARCPVHCYERARRDQIRAVMRFAGPRMLWRHPVLSLCHWLDGLRPAPIRTRPAG